MGRKGTKTIASFLAVEPRVSALPSSSGGGFRLVLEIPESEFENIKELNDPKLKSQILRIEISFADL